MSTPEKPPQDPNAEQAEAPKKKRGKLFLVIFMVMFVLGAGGGAGWYFFMRPADPNAPKVAEKPKPAIFMPLESFTVNLVPTDGQAQYVQAGLTLKLDDAEAADLIKERMPQVRDRVLMVLSSKRSTELLSTQGKQKLAAEISEAVKNVILPGMKPHAPAKHAAVEVAPVAAAAAAETPAEAEDKDKHADANAAEAKSSEAKTSEAKTAEGKTAEGKTAEGKTAEAKTAEPKTAEAKTSETKTGEAKTKDAKPAKPGLVIEVLFTAFIIQ